MGVLDFLKNGTGSGLSVSRGLVKDIQKMKKNGKGMGGTVFTNPYTPTQPRSTTPTPITPGDMTNRDPAIEQYIASIATANANFKPGDDDFSAYVGRNPEWAARTTKLVGKGKKFATMADYGRFLYDTYGRPAGDTIQPESKYISSDGTTFTTPEQYRQYQSQINTQLYGQNLQLGKSRARLNAENALRAQGLDPTQYQAYIDKAIGDVEQYIPKFDADPGSYFSPTIGDDILSNLTTTNRNQYGNAVRNQFTPTYSNEKISDTALDSTINDILSSQYGTAKESFDRGLKRGQYNNAGYSAALKGLETAKQTGTAKLNAIEGDVLSGYRSKLDTVRNNASSAASGYTLGSPFDINDYVTQGNNVVQDFQTNGSGTFLNAFGDQNLFDLGKLMTTAGTAQGAQNLNNLDLADALERRKAAAQQTRGLGSQGAF